MKEEEWKKLQLQIDSITPGDTRHEQVFSEIKTQYPFVKTAIIQHAQLFGDSTSGKTMLIIVLLKGKMPVSDKVKLEKWLTVRSNRPNINLIFQ